MAGRFVPLLCIATVEFVLAAARHHDGMQTATVDAQGVVTLPVQSWSLLQKPRTVVQQVQLPNGNAVMHADTLSRFEPLREAVLTLLDAAQRLPFIGSLLRHINAFREEPLESKQIISFTAKAGHATSGQQAQSSTQVAPIGFPSHRVTWVYLLSGIFYVILIGLAATFHVQRLPPQIEPGDPPSAMQADTFHYALFGCRDDATMCCTVCFCLPCRWAETVSSMGFLSFPIALAAYLGLILLDQVSFCSSILLLLLCTTYRQRMRAKFGMEHGSWVSFTQDCCTYLWCGCCAIVQEARQVEEAYRTKHKAVCSAGP